METLNRDKSKLVKFSILYIASIILVGIAIASFWGPLPTYTPRTSNEVSNAQPLQNSQEAVIDNLLHQQFNNLYNLNQQYNANKVDSNSNAFLAISRDYKKAQQALQKSIDSLEQVNAGLDSEEAKTTISTITASFKNALISLESSKAPNNVIVNSTDNSKALIADLTSDLAARDSRIKELENQVASANSSRAPQTSPNTSKLEENNKFLSNSLRQVVSDNGKLIKSNTAQKQTIDRLNKQIEAFKKFTSGQ